jgi:hypothetical protein
MNREALKDGVSGRQSRTVSSSQRTITAAATAIGTTGRIATGTIGRIATGTATTEPSHKLKGFAERGTSPALCFFARATTAIGASRVLPGGILWLPAPRSISIGHDLGSAPRVLRQIAQCVRGSGHECPHAAGDF